MEEIEEKTENEDIKETRQICSEIRAFRKEINRFKATMQELHENI